MSIFDAGVKLLNSAHALSGCPISYRRGEDTLAVDIPAKLGRTVFRYIDASGLLTRTEQRDFIVLDADLPIIPETGDEIIFRGEIYLVTAPNDEPCWGWHTYQNQSEKRIHAKKTGDN